MSTANGHGNGIGIGSIAAVIGARPVVLLRARPGIAAETARVVHLAPLPSRGVATNAVCGALLRSEEYETVTPGHEMPCDLCIASHLVTADLPPAAPTTSSAPDPTTPGVTPKVAALGYRGWGWPVTLRRDQVWLALGGDVIALLMPSLLAAEVTARLARRCPPAVLVHPYAPKHRVLLCGERFGVALPWPAEVHRVSGTLLLPPTLTPHGPLTWAHPPGPDSLTDCREIDIVSAVRAVLCDLLPTSGPMYF